ncbi:MAG: SDR family oxidoreductase [Desulfobacterales bacterium]|nr:SDR family oxidoreductase [Desulfobacterales bacterium]
MAFDLTGKKVLITGGTAGIGLATAKRFINNGAEVIISGRRDNGADIAQSIGARFIRADMAKDDDIRQLFKQAKQQLNGLNVVINNAGIGGGYSTITESTMDEFDNTFQINTRAAYHVLQQACQHIEDGGNIINTASVSGMEGEGNASIYCATKAVLINFTKTAAIELAARKVRVNSVSPGPIKSEIWEDEEDPTDWCKVMIPLARMGEADEAAAPFHFLAADDSSYITGTNIVVDGGYMAGPSLQSETLI